jgi:uncharacterized membrane protein YphA (DoxX/SURF4 family)
MSLSVKQASQSPVRADYKLPRFNLLSSNGAFRYGYRYHRLFSRIETKLVDWLTKHSLQILRLTLGLVFLWFGAVKFFPGLSSAENLAARTIFTLTAGLVPAYVSVPVLAGWECLIGLGLLFGRFMRLTLALLFLQMAGTFLPLLFFPAETWRQLPVSLTLEGQYIVKNIVLISAGLVLSTTLNSPKKETKLENKIV